MRQKITSEQAAGVADAPGAPEGGRDAAPQVRMLLAVVFIIYLAQMTLNPIIAPLSREVGLEEWQIGVTISAAAVMVVLTSQAWGRRSQSIGRKPVLVASFALAAVVCALFALVSWLAMAGALTGIIVFLGFVLLRGVGFGVAIAAVGPTAQAYIADVTPDEQARVKGMAGIGAAQGIAMVGGSVVGGALAAFGMLVPLLAVPALLVGGLVVLLLGLRKEPRHALIAEPARVRPSDARFWPFLLAGFGLFTSLGVIQIVTGFVIQDRLGLDAEATGLATGGAMLIAGLGLIAAQVIVVPRSGWSPATLLRIGSCIALVGLLALIPDAGVAPICISMLLIGLGMGIGTPGFTAGPTLLARRKELGGLAGLSIATTGLTFVIAPVLGAVLYGMLPIAPILLGAALMLSVALFVLLHPRFRRLPATPEGVVGAAEAGAGPARSS